MITLMHGTSMENAMEILKHGFREKETIWDCSNPQKLYCIGENKYDGIDGMTRFAVEAAQICAASQDSKYNHTVIFVFEMTKKIFESYFAPDTSCPNMENCYEIDMSELNRLICSHKIKMTAKVAEDTYQSYYRAFYLAHICYDYYTFKDIKLQQLCEEIGKCDNFFYEWLDVNTSIQDMPDFTLSYGHIKNKAYT